MKKKISCLLLILTLLIAKTPLNVLAVNNENQITSPQGSSNTELDGKIGEWDPGNEDQPNFSEDLEIEGNIPQSGEYFTISVTVPLEMEFIVLPSSQAFGYFSSAEYTVKNNGSKTITAKVKNFEADITVATEPNETPLYVEPVGGDKRTQMELKLTAINEEDEYYSKHIDLYRLNNLTDSEKELFTLSKNETRRIKFSSEKWELPQYESNKDSAKSGYTLGLEFSISDS